MGSRRSRAVGLGYPEEKWPVCQLEEVSVSQE